MGQLYSPDPSVYQYIAATLQHLLSTYQCSEQVLGASLFSSPFSTWARSINLIHFNHSLKSFIMGTNGLSFKVEKKERKWVRLSIVPPCQMPPNGHPLLPNSGRLLVPVSEGCCRVHNANIQGIHVKIQPLFPGEAVLLFEPGGRHFGGVCNTNGGRSHSRNRTTQYLHMG